MNRILLIFSICFASVFTFSQEKFFTCINTNGERMFSIKAHSAYPYSDGMAEVSQSVLEGAKSYYRWGFIDETGKLVIPCIYEKVYSFAFGVAWVKEPGAAGYYLINKKGERLSKESWDKVGYFIEGFSAVYDSEDRMGFVNRKGEHVIPCKYSGDSFSEGMACVLEIGSAKEAYGFIDTTGKVVIPLQYTQAGTSSFENGECRVQLNGITCLINTQGEVIFKPTLTKNCMGFSNGLSASYTKYETRSGWGYYNRQNQWVVKPQYDSADDFKGGLAVIGIGDKYGVIDTTGKIIIPIQYQQIYAHAAEDGYFALASEMNGVPDYVKADGSPFTTVPIKYMIGAPNNQPLAYCNDEDIWGYLNPDGTILVKAAFNKTMAFSEGKAWIWENVTSLPIAKGFSEINFSKDFKVGDKAKCQKNKQGEYLPVTVDQVTEYYYLVSFTDGSQVWVVYNELKR